MRTFSLILCQLFCIVAAAIAADEKPIVIPQKLEALLATQGKDGKPVITPEQRTYFDGLNDHIKALLGNAAEKEIITRADHLGFILALGLRPQKMEVFARQLRLSAPIPKSRSPNRFFPFPRYPAVLPAT